MEGLKDTYPWGQVPKVNHSMTAKESYNFLDFRHYIMRTTYFRHASENIFFLDDQLMDFNEILNVNGQKSCLWHIKITSLYGNQETRYLALNTVIVTCASPGILRIVNSKKVLSSNVPRGTQKAYFICDPSHVGHFYIKPASSLVSHAALQIITFHL